jgi:hypothetical protein
MSASQKVEIVVSFPNGETERFGARATCKKKVLCEGDNPVGVRLRFRNGEERTLHLSEVRHLAAYAECHGWLQKLGDSGSSATTAEAFIAEVDTILERVTVGGSWNAGERSVDSELAKAIFGAGIVEGTLEEISSIVRDMTAKDRDALRAIPAVVEELAKMRRARITEEDSSAALAKFGIRQ